MDDLCVVPIIIGGTASVPSVCGKKWTGQRPSLRAITIAKYSSHLGMVNPLVSRPVRLELAYDFQNVIQLVIGNESCSAGAQKRCKWSGMMT